MWLKYLCKRGFCKLKADEQDDKRDDKSRDVFYSAVAEWVILIRLLLGHTEADQRDNRRACVSEIVERVSTYGYRSAYVARKELEAEKYYI